MLKIRTTTLQRILTLLVCMLICKIIVGVLLSYRNYMPPNFESDFLQGRAHYFLAVTNGRSIPILRLDPARSSWE